MKNIIFAFPLLLATFLVSPAQNLPINNSTGKITYIRVVDANGLSAADLFKYSKEWGAAKGFKVKSEDASKGEIVYEASSTMEYPGKVKTETGNVNFEFFVFLKDGKYRYIAQDFVHEGQSKAPSGGKLEATNPDCGAAGMSSASWVLIKKKTQSYMEALIVDYDKYIREIMNDPTKKSDW